MPIKITIPRQEFFNENTNEFMVINETSLTLEHSLVSISKWESKWHVNYLNNKDKTMEQVIDYLRCMTITQNIDPEIYRYIPESELLKVQKYIEDPMTATKITKPIGSSRSMKIVTSEVIYFYMATYNIPVEFEKWHLNRLLTLIDVCNEENKPKKKMSMPQIMSSNASLNAARRAMYNTKG